MICIIWSLCLSSYAGRTNTQAALERIRDEVFVVANGDRPDVRNVIMILTDGEPTEDLNGQLMETVGVDKKRLGNGKW